MTWESILQVIFGNSISISDGLAIVCSVLVPILSVYYNKFKNRLILKNELLNIKDEQIADLSSKIEKLEQGLGFMANMVSTAYLSSNTISNDTKKTIASYADKLDKIASLDLTGETQKLIEAVSTFVPNINDKKEELKEITEKAEELLDTANAATQEAIDKLKL